MACPYALRYRCRATRPQPFTHLALGLHLLGNVIKDLGPSECTTQPRLPEPGQPRHRIAGELHAILSRPCKVIKREDVQLRSQLLPPETYGNQEIRQTSEESSILRGARMLAANATAKRRAPPAGSVKPQGEEPFGAQFQVQLSCHSSRRPRLMHGLALTILGAASKKMRRGTH